MGIEEHYRTHDSLTSEQIEHLLAVHRAMKEAIAASQTVYELLPPQKPPFVQALAELRSDLKHLSYLCRKSQLPPPPDLVSSSLAHSADRVEVISHMLDECFADARTYVDDICLRMMQALAAVPPLKD